MKAPDIVLNVDHIDPVAGGGGNEIINLITSCFDCNNGKRDKKLDDNSAVEKHRKQLELIQERREQIELMLDWKKSLANFDNDIAEMIANYINSKIQPYVLNDSGMKSVIEWSNKFTTDKILDGIDAAAKRYLKFNTDGAEQESVELFINKIGGVIIFESMPPIKQKIAYIKGIGRNRFEYWNEQVNSIILKNYVDALEQYGWNEEQIVKDLEDEVMPLTKNAENWNVWKSTLEKWTEDIKGWDKAPTKDEMRDNYYSRNPISFETLQSNISYDIMFAEDKIEASIYLGKAFSLFNESNFRSEINRSVIAFIDELETLYNKRPGEEIEEDEHYPARFIENGALLDYFDPTDDNENYGMLTVLSEKAREILEELFRQFYLPKTLYKRSDMFGAIIWMPGHLGRQKYYTV